MSGRRLLGPVVELWDVERTCPWLAAPREDFGLRREPLVEAIESAFLHVNDARAVFEVVGDHPRTAIGTKDAIKPLVRTCFGVRTVGEALGTSTEDGEIRLGHHHPRSHLCARRSLAICAVAVSDEGRVRIEPVRHLAAGTVTGVLLAHISPPSQKRTTLTLPSPLGRQTLVNRHRLLSLWGERIIHASALARRRLE